jgi:purine-nucleoside phosphorylase
VTSAARRPILIVAAWAPELAALRRPKVAGMVMAEVGVGLVEAAEGTARALAKLRPRALILVGTAGRYPGNDAPGVGQVAIVGRSILACGDAEAGRAYWPAPLPRTTEPTQKARLAGALARSSGAPIVDVACPLAITRATSLARSLGRSTGAQLENLEAFAVLRAAAAAGVPCAAVLGVTNVVGPAAHAEWRRHAASAAAAACGAVRGWLSGHRAPH